MLTCLSIRDFVLARAIDIELGDGFSALTGETGAGKSILIAALGFALGDRGGQGLIRTGADGCSAAASFDAPAGHPVRKLLQSRGVEIAGADPLVFRRVMKRGGAARAFLNDQPVSAALLSEAGALLADIHGQHEGHGLLNTGRHRSLVDSYGRLDSLVQKTADAWAAWRCAREAHAALSERAGRAAAERAWLAHVLGDLDALEPDEGEPERLALERAAMQAGERVAEGIGAASHALAKANVEGALSNAIRAVSRALAMPQLTGEGAGAELAVRLRAASETLERALIETGEARGALDMAAAACEFSPAALEASETRLFALRAAARKLDVDAAQLPALRRRLRLQLDEITGADAALSAAAAAESSARGAYLETALALSARRNAAGRKLAKAVAGELAALKLERARFRVQVTRRDEAEASAAGLDDVVFEIATNAGADFGPLAKIASGGELARFALAVSVCLAGDAPAGVLVFDEADVGVGGAVAAAIGERLGKLGQTRQVLAITHSPQVAAAASHQWRIAKDDTPDGTTATAAVLAPRARREEIARMLAGANVTREARAAASRLLAGA